MSRSRFAVRILVLAALVGSIALAAFAQQKERPKPEPKGPIFTVEEARKLLAAETPEQRMTRLAVSEDPGPDPDPKKVWIRLGKQMVIEKFDLKWTVFDVDQQWMFRPISLVNIPAELYALNDKYAWAWMEAPKTREDLLGMIPPSTNPSDASYTPLTEKGKPWVEQLKKEMTDVVTPADSGVTVHFEESSKGLPVGGSWRNGLDVADMNEDGFLDIIAPPQRGGAGSTRPSIFLGDGQGNWKLWSLTWPKSINYGTVAVGDLNGDGHKDIVAAIHLRGLAAFLGDGKGHFTDASKGLPDTFPTRRVALADVDGDGKLDIVAISEGATANSDTPVTGTYLRAYINQNNAASWKQVDVAEPKRQVAGDWLAIGNFNGDKLPDIAGSSIIFSGTDLVYLSDGKASWKPFGRGWFPFYSLYWAMTAGKFTPGNLDSLVMSYGRAWSGKYDPAIITPPPHDRIVGLELVTFDKKGNATRKPIAQWESRKSIFGMASGDFDGDGNLDIIYTRPDPRQFVMLLGDGKGNFRTATLDGLAARDRTLYDIKVADVNGDKKPDVIVMYESSEMVKDGSINVFLNRGATKNELAGSGR